MIILSKMIDIQELQKTDIVAKMSLLELVADDVVSTWPRICPQGLFSSPPGQIGKACTRSVEQ